MAERSSAIRHVHDSYDEFGTKYVRHCGAGGYSDPIMSAGSSFDCSPTKVSGVHDMIDMPGMMSGVSDTKTDTCAKDFRYKKGATVYTFRIYKSNDEGTDTVSVKVSNNDTKQYFIKCTNEV